MEIKDIQELKTEMEKILPKQLLDDSKELNGNLVLSLDNYKRVSAMADAIVKKVSDAKRILVDELEELINKKSALVAEGVQIFNDRAEKIRSIDSEITSKQYTVGSLENTIAEFSTKVNTIQRNIDSLVKEKTLLDQDIIDAKQNLHQLQVQAQEIKNTTDALVSAKSKASQELVEVQIQVDNANISLKAKQNEIIIANGRLVDLKK